jgi:predicted glycogen debranching enzyme
VITARIGKPVEINALWYNALRTMASLAPKAGKAAEPVRKLADKVKASFSKFWDETKAYCYDVIDAPAIGNDVSLRPNQIFAVSLPESPLSPSQQKSVVDVCARRLLTSHGLRSLAMGVSEYDGHYGGSPQHRDSIYHQGTDRLGLADRPVCPRPFARLQEPGNIAPFSRTYGESNHDRWSRYTE